MELKKDNSFVVAELGNQDTLVKYQLKMLLNNQIKGLLSMQVHARDEQTFLYYDCSGKVSLKSVISRREMTQAQFLAFGISLLNMANEINEYQLADKGVVLESDHIYVEPDGFEASFIYLPLHNEDAGVHYWTDFLKNMISSGQVDITGGSLIKKIIDIINREFSGVGEVLSELRKLSAAVNVKSAPKASPVPKPVAISVEREQPDEPPKEEVKEKPEAPAKKELFGGKPFPGPKPKPETKKKPEKEKPQKEKGKTPPYQKVLLATIIMIIPTILAFQEGIFNNPETGELDLVSAMMVPLVILAVDYLLYKQFTKNPDAKDKGKDKKKEKKSKKNLFSSKDKKETSGTPRRIADFGPKKSSSPAVSPKNSQSAGEDMDKTVFFDEEDDKTILTSACLVNMHGEKFYISKDQFKVGRLQSDVDLVIKSQKVGRIHADILRRDNRYFVVDLSSLNGTHINGNPERIESNVEYEIFHGDRIKFADEEFAVYIE